MNVRAAILNFCIFFKNLDHMSLHSRIKFIQEMRLLDFSIYRISFLRSYKALSCSSALKRLNRKFTKLNLCTKLHSINFLNLGNYSILEKKNTYFLNNLNSYFL